MSYYDAEMVKKFATLNKELIEKTAKDHPEIGNLIKEIIESITEEPITLNTGAPEEDDKMWLSIPQAEELASSNLNRTITDQLESVGRFMGSNKSKNLTLKEIIDLVISTTLMGKFSQLSDDPKERETYRNIYGELEDYETIVKYSIDPKLHSILAKTILFPIGKDYVFDATFLEQFVAFFPKRGELTDEELQEMSNVLTNKVIFDFLKNLGKDGFWCKDKSSWFLPKVVAKDGVILNDEFGNKLELDPDFLRVELGISLFPISQPKFSMGDKVVLERTQNRQGEVGTIIERSYSNKRYIYSVQLEKATITNNTMTYNQTVIITAEESELEKATSTSTTQPQKPVLPTPSTPEEIEISQMSKEQLKELKEELEETLTYLEDDDPEKNDLLGQINFLNLYLEN